MVERRAAFERQLREAFPTMTERHVAHRVAAMLHMQRLENEAIEARRRVIELLLGEPNQSLAAVPAEVTNDWITSGASPL